MAGNIAVASTARLNFRFPSIFPNHVFLSFSHSIKRPLKTRIPQTRKEKVGFQICCKSSKSKTPTRSAHMLEVMQEAEERASIAKEPIPQIKLEHVTVNFARSGGPGGQNVNKVNTKVDMRFNVAAADWLSPWVKERIMQMEKNRINSDGELVISSTKTRTQKGNIEDALAKLQSIIDAASYVPPPPSEETKKKIKKLAAINNEKRLQKKKAVSQKKALRRDKGNWDF
eukprot:TRINITY_DN3723_c0_g1_i2.p1 TRINITY_DN3723_c0_g1~~TRINITY_DN3723_c0_g1_i2.p1  ORF type:complete len:228 (+),score=52.77 TRINITY_DN3723_c0_g1_i2:84-767(+)